MKTTKLLVLALGAAVLGGLAWYTNNKNKVGAPDLIGKRVLPKFDLSEIARIESGAGSNKFALASTEKGWVVSSLFNYPADITKIRENLLKLQAVKVSDVAEGKQLTDGRFVDLQNASGKSIAALTLGNTHQSQAAADSPYGGGGYPDGRYVQAGGSEAVVLISDTLDAFDGDPKKWTETQIASVPSSDVTAIMLSFGKENTKLTKKDGSWTLDGIGTNEEFNTSNTYSVESALSYLNFTSVADPALSPDALGLNTGAVYTIQTKQGQVYTANVGSTVPGGTDRYVKLSATFSPTGTNTVENAKYDQQVKDFNAKNGNWVYTIASYNADNLTKKRADFVKEKEPPKKEEPAADAKPAKAEPAK